MSGLALTVVTGAAQALEVSPMIKGGVDYGGDTVATVLFTDGSTKSIKANEGFYFGGGIAVLNDAETLEAELSISYKVGLISASNGTVTFTRVPLDALAFYRWPRFRVGGGVTFHMDPNLDGSGAAGNINRRFDDAAGLVLQGQALVTRKLALGVRYTNIEYKQKGSSATFKGDGIGLAVSYRF